VAADTVKPLHYVPQLYAFSWVSAAQARDFFRSLSTVPEKVRIYITGRNVWSVPNSADLAIVQDYLGHGTSWWWNYPCNDNDVTKLFTMDTYANFRDEQHIATLARLEADLKGTPTLIINPMQQGEVSKIALFSVADYAWNHSGFDNHRSWEAALPAVVGKELAPALRTLAPYLRYFDADALAYEVRNYRRSVDEGHPRPWTLAAMMRGVVEACGQLETMKTSPRPSDRLFYEDVRPWLLKLKAMAAETADRLDGKAPVAADLQNAPDFQFPILTGLGNEIDLSVKTAEPAAEVLQPFLEWLRTR
jgi:hyaluronoglucosaminidase